MLQANGLWRSARLGRCPSRARKAWSLGDIPHARGKAGGFPVGFSRLTPSTTATCVAGVSRRSAAAMGVCRRRWSTGGRPCRSRSRRSAKRFSLPDRRRGSWRSLPRRAGNGTRPAPPSTGPSGWVRRRARRGCGSRSAAAPREGFRPHARHLEARAIAHRRARRSGRGADRPAANQPPTGTPRMRSSVSDSGLPRRER